MTLCPNCFTVITVFKSNPLPNLLVTVNENDEINKINFEGRRTVVLIK